jgi:hypothetical protein
VDGDDKNCLIYLLGFDQKTGMEFLKSSGLIKEGHSRNSSAIVVVMAEWDQFIVEERLVDLMEPVNKTKKNYFINIGDKKMLSHRPIDQFSDQFELKDFAGYLCARQRRLHKELSEMLISLRPKIVSCIEEVEEEEIEHAVDVVDKNTSSSVEPIVLPVFVEEHKEISAANVPMLFEMFKGSETVPVRHLNALYCDLQNVLKKNDNSVDFTYGNGKCGRTVIIPKFKTQASFMEKARKLKWIDSMLEHMVTEVGKGTDMEDAAEWLCYYLGKSMLPLSR